MQETIQAELQAAHEQQKIEKAQWAADGDLLRSNPNYGSDEDEDEEAEEEEEEEDDEEERAAEEQRQQEAVEKVKRALLEKERAKKAEQADAGSEDEVEELIAGMAKSSVA